MYEDKNIDKRKHLSVLINESSSIANDDNEYVENLKKIKPKKMTLDECIEFYKNWVNIYRDVKKNWYPDIDNQ